MHGRGFFARAVFPDIELGAALVGGGVAHQLAHEVDLAAAAFAAGRALRHADRLIEAFGQRQLLEAFGGQFDQLFAQPFSS
ncbi:hypothetical protein G6F58_013780 [Rhizopus delemar]|nr:hypothetical protein G6F58_013780 [Rhizopus delemar]